MSTDHEQRLTICNRKLVEEVTHAGIALAAHQKFLRRLTDPEDLGHAVSEEVRREAAALLA